MWCVEARVHPRSTVFWHVRERDGEGLIIRLEIAMYEDEPYDTESTASYVRANHYYRYGTQESHDFTKADSTIPPTLEKWLRDKNLAQIQEENSA